MAKCVEISIAKDFTPFPAGRIPRDGPYNGQSFREDYLKPLLRDNDQVTIILDGVAGLPSSFLEEIFGGLIRKNIIKLEDIGKRLIAKTNEKHLEWYIPIAYKYALDAARVLT